MDIFKKIFSFIFQSPFQKNDFSKFHKSLFHKERWIFSLWGYQHPKVKKLIRYLKNHNDFLLKKEIAEEMKSILINYLSEQQQFSYFKNPIVISVPISHKRFRERGFNQTHLLAKYLAKEINGVYQKNIIKKHTTTRKQALIQNRQKRFENIKGVFSAQSQKKHLIKNQDFIIVDDLTTTGATLTEIRKVLKKHGARNVIAITIAH